jgi:peptidoglycan/xylan/chitin deacetylase (PgdA/CDA1 family)
VRNVKLGFFMICKTLGLFRLMRWITRRQLKILCYHGFEIVDECSFRPNLFIKPAEFDNRLAKIRRFGMRVASLDEAVDQLYSGSLPDNTVVLTVDDGFHSTHTLALPLLQKHACTATVYVTTYYVEHANPIFRLIVQYMFFRSTAAELVLKNVCWAPDGVVKLSNAAESEKAMWQCIEYGERSTEEERGMISEQLGELLLTPFGEIARSKMFNLMTPKQLQALAAAKMSIGLHTQRHSFSLDDRQLAEREITDNRAALQRCGVTAIDHFCYPSGEFDPRQAAWLDGMGVKSSTTCLPGLNTPATPRHAMRRFLDGHNIHPLEFEAAVSGFSDLLRNLVKRGPA